MEKKKDQYSIKEVLDKRIDQKTGIAQYYIKWVDQKGQITSMWFAENHLQFCKSSLIKFDSKKFAEVKEFKKIVKQKVRKKRVLNRFLFNNGFTHLIKTKKSDIIDLDYPESNVKQYSQGKRETKKQQKIEQRQTTCTDTYEPQKIVIQSAFLNKSDSQLKFKVKFNKGIIVMGREEVLKKDPMLLIIFYEKHLNIFPKVPVKRSKMVSQIIL